MHQNDEEGLRTETKGDSEGTDAELVGTEHLLSAPALS